jgi:hypothetical protein
MPNHLVMRFQANRQRGGLFREQRTEWIFLFFAVMSQLPIL